MTLVDLDNFMSAIRPYAPGCANITAFAAIRLAAIEFCERTKLWRWQDEFDVVAATDAALSPPAGSALIDLDKVFFEGTEMTRVTPSYLDLHAPGWRTNDLTGTPNFVTQLDLNTIRLVPTEDGHVNVYGWIKPTPDATQVPDFMVNQYREVIAAGALARLLSQPNQPYSNPNTGAGYAALFDLRLTELSSKAQQGQQRAPRRARAHMF